MKTALTGNVQSNFKNISIALVSGLSTPLGFAPHDLHIVPFITILLITLLSINSSKKSAATYGYVFGLGFFGYGVNWLHISINLFGGINLPGAWLITFLLVLYMALFPAIFAVMISILCNDRDLSFKILIFSPAAWTLLEWLRGWFLTGFPWLNLGYSQTDTLLSGLAPLFGVYGIGFIMVFISMTVLLIIKGNHRTRLYSGVIVVILGASIWALNNYNWTIDSNRSLSVALIQGAVPQEIKWSQDMRQPTKKLYLELTSPHLQADLIIWPEAAIPAYYHQEEAFLNEVHKVIRERGSTLLTGMPVYERDTDSFFNSAIFFDNKISFYFKQHLVPFGEYLPVKFLLQPLVDLFKIPIADFSSGKDSRPILESEKFNIGISICYEDTFGNEVIRALPEANILVNISNDAWFGDSLAPHQHLQMARMRAQETGRYLLRATNTGITAIIDNKGKILSRSPQFVKSSLAGSAQLYEGETPYSRSGNYPVIAFCILILCFFIYRKRIDSINRIYKD